MRGGGGGGEREKIVMDGYMLMNKKKNLDVCLLAVVVI